MANYMAEIAKILDVEHKQKPSFNQIYYYVDVNGGVEWNFWDNDAIDYGIYIIGNFYPTRKEAEANREKWVAFYASCEVLEV